MVTKLAPHATRVEDPELSSIASYLIGFGMTDPDSSSSVLSLERFDKREYSKPPPVHPCRDEASQRASRDF